MLIGTSLFVMQYFNETCIVYDKGGKRKATVHCDKLRIQILKTILITKTIVVKSLLFVSDV